MRRRWSAGLALAVAGLAGTARPGAAWGGDAHRVVAEIAWRRLAAPVRAEVAALLPAGETLAGVASWADEVRAQSAWSWTDRLHYLNVPRAAAAPDLARDCPDGDCVVGAIERFRRELADRRLPAERRGEALRFLVHFVADLHQPLHVGHREDRGGNDVEVVFFGRRDDLHAVWDVHLLARRRRSWLWGGSPEAIAARLAAAIDAGRVASWRPGTPLDWARESLALARAVAYPCPPELPRLPAPLTGLGEVPSWLYYLRAVDPLEERLQRAGLRLADLLAGALAPGR